MSECRCSDIKTCKKNIKRLEQASEELDHLATPYMRLADYLKQLAHIARNAYDSETHEEFAYQTEHLKDDMGDAMDTCKKSIDSKLKKLNASLSSMEKEDEDYHEHEDDDVVANGMNPT